ncbi:MAG: hypothetical protein ACP5O3_02210 [Candidatus Micrarchaeia archaeon]|jgi:uncharacterized protein (UPF0333 family)
MDEKAQGAIEYILLAGAVVLFIVIVITVIKAFVLQPGANQTQNASTEYFTQLANFSNATVNP